MNGIPTAYNNTYKEDIIPRTQAQVLLMHKLVEVFKEDKRTLIILGDSGVGKTMLCSAVFNTYTSTVSTATLYITLQELSDSLYDSYNSPNYHSLSYFCSFSALVIDEFLPSIVCKSLKTKLNNLIVSRFDNNKKTVLIGHVKPSELRNVFEERAISRLNEGASIYIQGQNLRNRK